MHPVPRVLQGLRVLRREGLRDRRACAEGLYALGLSETVFTGQGQVSARGLGRRPRLRAADDLLRARDALDVLPDLLRVSRGQGARAAEKVRLCMICISSI